MTTEKIRIYKTKPTNASGYKPTDVARNANQARSICKNYRESGYFCIIVKTNKQGKIRTGSMKGESRLTYTLYTKEK